MNDCTFINFFNFWAEAPEAIEKSLAPISGELKVKPVKTPTFGSKVSARQLCRLAVFTVEGDLSAVKIRPPHKFVGLHLPLGRSLVITENRRKTRFDHDIHLLRPERELSLQAPEGLRVLVANMYSEQLQDYALKLTASDESAVPKAENRIAITTPAGLLLARNLANLWSELRFMEFSPGSDISIAELEDALLANFITAIETPDANGLYGEHQGSAQEIVRAEEFLDANLTQPVSRADLAAVAGVSIRTLSRGFLKRHGMGPMEFLKARRLDAVYRQLLGAETGSTRVQEVAARYGFNHLGRFAIEFKKTFGESPSVTLTR